MANPNLYNQSLALLTDQYQMTMSYGYWKRGLNEKEAVFHLFFRKKPFGGGFTIAAGLEGVIHYLEKLRFDASDLSYLSMLKDINDKQLFEPKFLDYLENLRFTCSIDAVPEGTAVFPYQPLLRVQGPIIQCQLLETPLLNLINFPSLIATKAARVTLAAKEDEVIEFGLRRAQGIDGAVTASRSAYIGGCHSTSNILAGKLFGIPVKGTHSHSWVMLFDSEIESFESYAEALPSNCVFLVDTFSTIEGVKNAIQVGYKLKERGYPLLGIRLDSGDLADLSQKARKMLDDTGFKETKIVASNELDEILITDLKRQGAKIVVWGVGTNLITAKDQPALDGVYKLSAVRDPGKDWKYKLKLSEQMTKVSNPGILQVRRYFNDSGNIADVLYDVHSNIDKGSLMVDPFDVTRQMELKGNFRDLLVPIYRDGKRVYSLPTLDAIRDNAKKELSMFSHGVKRFFHPHQYLSGMEKTLFDKKLQLIQEIREKITS